MGSKEWKVLSSAFQENLTNRVVKPSEELLRLGAVDGPWEVELKIPQQHIGQVLKGFVRMNKDELDVDFIVRSDPTRKFKGKLTKIKIGGEANPERSSGMEAEPVVIACVTLVGVDKDYELPRELLRRVPKCMQKSSVVTRKWVILSFMVFGNSSTKNCVFLLMIKLILNAGWVELKIYTEAARRLSCFDGQQ